MPKLWCRASKSRTTIQNIVLIFAVCIFLQGSVLTMDLETLPAPKLRKRKAVEYAEDNFDDDDTSSMKKAKSEAKSTKTKPGISLKKTESTKKIPKTKETKVAKSKVTKALAQNDDDINIFDNTDDIPNVWNEAEMLAQVERIPLQLAQNLIGLLTEGCTLPFIARYRKTAVDNLMPDR